MKASEFKIPQSALEIRTSRSSGAGGQHVNKIETKVEARFHLSTAKWIPPKVRERMAKRYSNRINLEGEFIVTCDETRSLLRNKELCFKKLKELIVACWSAPKKRIGTKPTKSSRRKRVEEKKQVGAKKKNRKPPGRDE